MEFVLHHYTYNILMLLCHTHFRKKTFEICCCAVASVEYTDEMFLLIFWKRICSRIWKFLCCPLMAFLFWSFTLFGDECNIKFTISFSAKILTISSAFALFLLLLFLLFPFLPVDFEARFKVDPHIGAPHVDRLIHLIIWAIWPNAGIN